MIAPMLLRGRAACDAAASLGTKYRDWVPTQEHGNHQKSFAPGAALPQINSTLHRFHGSRTLAAKSAQLFATPCARSCSSRLATAYMV